MTSNVLNNPEIQNLNAKSDFTNHNFPLINDYQTPLSKFPINNKFLIRPTSSTKTKRSFNVICDTDDIFCINLSNSLLILPLEIIKKANELRKYKKNNLAYSENLYMLINMFFNDITRLSINQIYNPDEKQEKEINRLIEMIRIKAKIYTVYKLIDNLNVKKNFIESQIALIAPNLVDILLEYTLTLEEIRIAKSIISSSIIEFKKFAIEQKGENDINENND
ncbi:hypothetical protein GVAV_001595 [Gurleya vavrai]